MVKETVNAVLATLHDMGMIQDTRSKTLTYRINDDAGIELSPTRISEWLGGNPKAREDLPRLAIRALGLNHYGFDEALWLMPASEAARAVKTSVGGGIASMLGGMRPRDARFRTIAYTTQPEQSPQPHLGLDQASNGQDRAKIPVPPPTDSLTVRGQATIYARTLHERCNGLHVRVLIEDILGGSPRFHQVNRYLGLESGILPIASEVDDRMSLSFDPSFPAGQQSRIWTFLRTEKFGDDWLSPDAPAGMAHDIPCESVQRMMEHVRLSPPGQFDLYMTLVHYQPCSE